MIHHFIRAALLAGFAFMIVYLFNSGQAVLYIAPRMELLVKLSALGLYAAAVYQIFAALRSKSKAGSSDHGTDCDCGHHHSKSPFKGTVMYGLFLLPLLTILLVPTSTLGSAMAEKKGISFTGSESVNRDAGAAERSNSDGAPDVIEQELDALFPYDEYTVDHAKLGKKLYGEELIIVPEKQFIETLTTLDLYRDALAGKEVEISGFVYREEEMGEDRIAVSRFAMNCCSADALPYGLVITWPKAEQYNEDEWIKVKGELTVIEYDGNSIISLQASKIERIAAPSTPYVYPDFEFGT
ncbi:TIGR03943 family putative permease subunit [Paenibacillus soyae]|uniref:TIGR03943 family protein n=1 Tax=Paenibacillus soyae TaxID=2969249 RepID=A0A9X2MTG3_9BACL|nr:TIGR03943 family protein [Paenibacillus soyae]MCR2806170.1 TIGR03943 family protein [Paenibacillus soyae]